jgi:arylamine N-acetyltransferase
VSSEAGHGQARHRRSGVFAGIGYSGSADATLETLTELVAAHGRCIPFESLDPLLG